MQPIPGAFCAVHPHASAVGTCPRCGNFVCPSCLVPDAGLMCEQCRSLVGGAVEEPTAWERRGEVGLVTAYLETLKASMFKPDAFWRSVPAQGALGDAMLYGWLTSLIAAVPNFLLLLLQFESQVQTFRPLLSDSPELLSFLEGLTPVAGALLLTVTPTLLYPLFFIITSGIVHLGCLLWGAGPKGFTATARVLGYSQGPMLLSWIPCIGGLAGVYVLVLEIFGVMRVHRVSGGRAAGGVLTLPILIFLCVCGIALVVAVTLFRGR